MFAHCKISDTAVAGDRYISTVAERLHDLFVQCTQAHTSSSVMCSYLSRALRTPTDHMMRKKSELSVSIEHVYIAS